MFTALVRIHRKTHANIWAFDFVDDGFREYFHIIGTIAFGRIAFGFTIIQEIVLHLVSFFEKAVLHIHLRASSFNILTFFVHIFLLKVTFWMLEIEKTNVKNWALLIKPQTPAV